MSGEKIKNIGPKSMAWLRQTGVRSLDDLKATGSLSAYVRIKRAGFKPSLNLLYAMEGAILGCHWQDLPPQPKYKRMPAASPVTTTHMEAEEGTAPEPDFGFDSPDAGQDD